MERNVCRKSKIRFATLFPMNWYTTKSLFLSQSTALKRNISSTPVANRTMYDIALEMQANAAGYTRISDVNGQGQNYQEAYVSNVSIGNSYQIKLLKTMVLPKDPFSLI